MDYDTRDIASIDMKGCNPASFQWKGEKSYFDKFGHPTHHMTRVAINSPLTQDIMTSFVGVQE